MSALLPQLALAASLGGFLHQAPEVARGFPTDDAWIHQVYARAFAHGGGFAYNDGEQEAGSTSPLWVVVSAPAHWLAPLGGESAPVVGVKGIGALFAALGIEAVRRIALRLVGSPFAAAAAAGLYAVEPRLAFSALSGMEVVMLVALWLGAAEALLAGRTRAALVLAGLLPLARPEAGIVSLAIVGLLFWREGPRARLWRGGTTWLTLIGPGAAWVLFCLATNGHPLPNTFYLKTTGWQLDAEHLTGLARVLTDHGWAAAGPAFAFGLLGLAARSAVARDGKGVAPALLLAAPAAYALAIGGLIRLHPEGYYWLRYADPAALVATAAFAIGATFWITRGALAVWRRAMGESGGEPWRDGPLGAAMLLACLLGLGPLEASFDERRARLASDVSAIHRINVAAGRWIHANTPEDALIGVNDAGALRYFGGRRTVDLAGLNNALVAFRRPEGARLVAQLDYVAVFPSWFAGSTFLREFETVTEFHIPFWEYTICECPGQSTKRVARRVREPERQP